MTASAIDAAMPQLTLAFPGLDGTGDLTMVTAATRSYLLRAQNGTGLPVYCSMFSPADDQILLGAAALRDHVIDFDKPRQRIGVAPSRGCAG